jgi:deoxyribonuclease-4
MNVGAHVRGGGKLVPSLEFGVEMGATSIQIFTQSPRMWKPSQYAPEVLAAYREAAAVHPSVTDTFCHATYLINLATADRDLYDKSVACLTHNLSVARGIASSGLVLHVGSHHGAGFDGVVRQIADAFERALADADPTPEGVAECPILIENAAGSGGTVGRSLEEIGLMIDACNGDDRLGLCIDTQHLWASGFDYSSEAGANRLVEEVELTVGMDRLRCLHFNDSKIELGGNRDRHANIGEGTIGAGGLAPLVGHPRIRHLPLLLEVPGDGDGPRAIDVTVGRHTVAAGIALYDGNAMWEGLLPAISPATPSKKTATKRSAPEIDSTPVKKVSKKKTGAAKTTSAKKGTAKVTAAKKTPKKAAKKAGAPAKKSPATKSASGKSAKKSSAKKTTAKKTTAKKTTAKKTTAKKSSAKKSSAKKSSAKKSSAKKSSAKKSSAKKSSAKKTTAKKTTAKNSVKKSGKKAAKSSAKSAKKSAKSVKKSGAKKVSQKVATSRSATASKKSTRSASAKKTAKKVKKAVKKTAKKRR